MALVAVALFTAGVAAVVLRDNDLARLPVTFYAITYGDTGPIGLDTDPGQVLVAVGVSLIAVAVVVGVSVAAAARRHRIAWVIILTMGVVLTLGGIAAIVVTSELLRWITLSVTAVAVLVVALLASPSARAYFTQPRHQQRRTRRVARSTPLSPAGQGGFPRTTGRSTGQSPTLSNSTGGVTRGP